MKLDVTEVLNQLAKGFNVAVEELYPVLYKQAMISGVFNTIWFLIFVAAVSTFVTLLIKIPKWQEKAERYEWDWDEPRAVLIIVIGSILSIFALFVIPMSLDSAITALFNPDFYIIETILNKIK